MEYLNKGNNMQSYYIDMPNSITDDNIEEQRANLKDIKEAVDTISCDAENLEYMITKYENDIQDALSL